MLKERVETLQKKLDESESKSNENLIKNEFLNKEISIIKENNSLQLQ